MQEKNLGTFAQDPTLEKRFELEFKRIVQNNSGNKFGVCR